MAFLSLLDGLPRLTIIQDLKSEGHWTHLSTDRKKRVPSLSLLNFGDESEGFTMFPEVVFQARTGQASPAQELRSEAGGSKAPSNAVTAESAAVIGEVYERCRDGILRLALRITSSPQDAEDVVQDCFLQAFLHLHSFAGRASLSTWIWRIAINAALVKIRKRRRYESSLDERTETASARHPLQIEGAGPAPDQQLLRRELQQALVEELAELSPALSKVVELHYFEELTMRECSHVLGISLSNAKGRILRAKLKLRPGFNRRFRQPSIASRLRNFPRHSFEKRRQS